MALQLLAGWLLVEAAAALRVVELQVLARTAGLRQQARTGCRADLLEALAAASLPPMPYAAGWR